MPIDAGIYNNALFTKSLAGGLADTLNNYQDRQNKMASLAQEQEMRKVQLDEAKGKQVFQTHFAEAVKNAGGDLRKARDIAIQSGHPDGLLFAQHADKIIKEQEAHDRQQQFGDVVQSIGQPDVRSNQFAQFTQGNFGQPTYTSVPETEESRQAKVMKMLALDPDAGSKIAGVLEKPKEFAAKQAEARAIFQEKAAQDERMARVVAGLRPAKEDNTLVAVIGPDGQTPTLVPRSQAAGMRPAAGTDKPLNDSQSKALLFGSRMKAADEIINQLALEGTSTSVPGSRSPIIGGVITAASSANVQSLDQAKRDFVNATLRRESGAVISDSEFDNAEKQYFPQIGDSPEVKKQKAANRNLAMRGIMNEVPEKHRGDLAGNDGPQAKDQEAIAWARANQNDPRAVQILKLHGM